MPRSASSIQTEIIAIEAEIAASVGVAATGANGTSIQKQRYADLTARLDQLYQQMDRATGNGKMLVRGTVSGLGRA